jgi:hypothetical protein
MWSGCFGAEREHAQIVTPRNAKLTLLEIFTVYAAGQPTRKSIAAIWRF